LPRFGPILLGWTDSHEVYIDMLAGKINRGVLTL
jgi:hypothetical protein